MWRRALKVMAISYAVKTALFLALWLAAPDLVRQAREKMLDVWAGLTRAATPAAAAIAPAAPHRAAGAVLRPVAAGAAEARPVPAVLR
jgi:hypothetical protein